MFEETKGVVTKSEAVHRRTDNSIVKRKGTKRQTIQ